MLAFSENYRKKSIFSLVKRTAFAALIGASLSGCLESGSSSSDDAKLGGGKTPTVKDVSISGFAVKGILAGAVVKAYDISGTTLLAETTTNAQGKYTLPAINHDGPILVKLETSADTVMMVLQRKLPLALSMRLTRAVLVCRLFCQALKRLSNKS